MVRNDVQGFKLGCLRDFLELLFGDVCLDGGCDVVRLLVVGLLRMGAQLCPNALRDRLTGGRHPCVTLVLSDALSVIVLKGVGLRTHVHSSEAEVATVLEFGGGGQDRLMIVALKVHAFIVNVGALHVF